MKQLQEQGAAKPGRQAAEQAVNRAFLAAVMLTANSALAEQAVIEAIRSFHVEDVASDAFLLCVVKRAVGIQSYPVKEGNPAENSFLSILPEELQRVVILPTSLRHCFVLRNLLGLSEEVCLCFLQTKVDVLSEMAGNALLTLAKLFPASDAGAKHETPSHASGV